MGCKQTSPNSRISNSIYNLLTKAPERSGNQNRLVSTVAK